MRIVWFQLVFCFFFFKQRTAYEMRISDWSSDVCSSDLRLVSFPSPAESRYKRLLLQQDWPKKNPYRTRKFLAVSFLSWGWTLLREIGRASCRERVCQYV